MDEGRRLTTGRLARTDGMLMGNEVRFSAPWSPTLRIVTILVCALLATVSVMGSVVSENVPLGLRLLAFIAPVGILVGTQFFVVRGYVLTENELRIERLGWANHIDLRNVFSATADPEAMRGSIRLWGSGGLFGFFGWYRNKKLGVYRAYCTDPKRSVIVKLTNRTIVVTPDNPDRFVEEIKTRRSFAGNP